jgi:hypothetical protein
MKIYFMTSNKNKAAEATAFFEKNAVKGAYNVEFRVITHAVQEILHPDLKFIVRKKSWRHIDT